MPKVLECEDLSQEVQLRYPEGKSFSTRGPVSYLTHVFEESILDLSQN